MSNFTKTTLPEPIIGISGPDNTPNPKRPGLTCIHEAKLLMEKLQKYGGRERTPSEWYSSMSFSAGRIIDMIVKMKRQVKLIGKETEKKLEETGVTIFNAAQKALAERSENGTYVLAQLYELSAEILAYCDHEVLPTSKIYMSASATFEEAKRSDCTPVSLDRDMLCLNKAIEVFDKGCSKRGSAVTSKDAFLLLSHRQHMYLSKAKLLCLDHSCEKDEIAFECLTQLVKMHPFPQTHALDVLRLAFDNGSQWQQESKYEQAIKWFHFVKDIYCQTCRRPESQDDNEKGAGASEELNKMSISKSLVANSVFAIAFISVSSSDDIDISNHSIVEYEQTMRSLGVHAGVQPRDSAYVPGSTLLKLQFCMGQNKKDKGHTIFSEMLAEFQNFAAKGAEGTQNRIGYTELIKCVTALSEFGKYADKDVENIRTVLHLDKVEPNERSIAYWAFIESLHHSKILYQNPKVFKIFFDIATKLQEEGTGQQTTNGGPRAVNQSFKYLVSLLCTVALGLAEHREFGSSKDVLKLILTISMKERYTKIENENIYLLCAHVHCLAGDHDACLMHATKCAADCFDKHFIYFKCMLAQGDREGTKAALKRCLQSQDITESRIVGLLFEVKRSEESQLCEQVMIKLLKQTDGLSVGSLQVSSKGKLAASLMKLLSDRLAMPSTEKSSRNKDTYASCLEGLKACNDCLQLTAEVNAFGSAEDRKYVVKTCVTIASNACSSDNVEFGRQIYHNVKVFQDLCEHKVLPDEHIDILTICALVKDFRNKDPGTDTAASRKQREGILHALQDLGKADTSVTGAVGDDPNSRGKVVYLSRVFEIVILALAPRSKKRFRNLLKLRAADGEFCSTAFFDDLFEECCFMNAEKHALIHILEAQLHHEMKSSTTSKTLATIFRRLCHYIGCDNANDYFTQALQIAKTMHSYPSEEADWMVRTLWNHGVELSQQARHDQFGVSLSRASSEPGWYFESAIDFAEYADTQLQRRLQELYKQYKGRSHVSSRNARLSKSKNKSGFDF
jgi:hypothetical protein